MVTAAFIWLYLSLHILRIDADFVNTVYGSLSPKVTFLAISSGKAYLGARFFTSVMQHFSWCDMY